MGRLLKRIFGGSAERKEIKEILLDMKKELGEVKQTVGEVKAISERFGQHGPEEGVSPKQVLDEYLNGVENE